MPVEERLQHLADRWHDDLAQSEFETIREAAAEIERLRAALREEAEELRGAIATFNQTRDLIPKTILQRREDAVRAEQARIRLSRLEAALSGKGGGS